MGLQELIAAENSRQRSKPALERLRASLGDDEYAELLTALHDPTIMVSAIQRALRSRGINISYPTLTRLRDV